MKSLFIAFGVCLFTSAAGAQIQFLDTPAVSHLLRDHENAAMMISGKGAKTIASYIEDSANPNAPVRCWHAGSDKKTETFCAIGQISRQGGISAISGEFAHPDFFANVLKKKTKPNGLVDTAWFEKYATETAVYPNQCQSPNYRRLQTLNVDIEGLAAEQLYNFLSVQEATSDSGSTTKESPDHFFSCEKSSRYDQADIDPNGSIAEDVRPSYTEYACSFRVLKSANLAVIIPCSIYGASSSAGGGR